MKLEEKGLYNLSEFVKSIKRLVIDESIDFDLIIGAGDSGASMVKIAEIVFQELHLSVPKTLLIPFFRFSQKDVARGEIFNSIDVYVSEATKVISGFSQIRNILFVDDEIGQGRTVDGVIKVLEKVIPDAGNINFYILAEDHGFNSDSIKSEIAIHFVPFSLFQKRINNAISYIIPYEIEKKITDRFTDREIGSKVRMNSLFELPSKELKDNTPFWSYEILGKIKKEIPNYYKLQLDFENYIHSIIKKIIEEMEDNTTMQKPTEEEIQKAIEILQKNNPEKATRENALKAIEGMRKMASALVDRVDEDLKSGKVVVSEDGKVTRND